MRILLVEDNQRLAELIVEGLEQAGFSLDRFSTREDAEEVLKSNFYDLILLDLGLPDGDGLELLRRWKTRAHLSTPVLIITARDGLDDRIIGLDAGADDYLVKPFDMRELAARCRALLRRPDKCLGTLLEAGNLTLDSRAKMARVEGRRIVVAARELALLELLMRRIGQVVPKRAIEDSLYALHAEVTPNAVEASVSRLRKKLAAAGATPQLHTAHGIGYGLFPAEEGPP